MKCLFIYCLIVAPNGAPPRPQNQPKEFWERKRRNYRRLCELCEAVDNEIAHLTMTSFFNNLFFICIQLLNSMKCVVICVTENI